MQSNADGIRPKLLEQRDILITSNIDIVAIQESKLQKADKIPLIEGYATICKDRNNILGGGLLFFVRKALFSKSYTPSKKQVRKSYPFESIHQNCYGLMYTTYTFTTPLLSTPTLIQTLSIHPLHSIIILYFNGHSHFWDHV